MVLLIVAGSDIFHYSIIQASEIRGFKSLIRKILSLKDMQRRLIPVDLKATCDL